MCALLCIVAADLPAGKDGIRQLSLGAVVSVVLALCAGPLLQMMAALGRVAKHYSKFPGCNEVPAVPAVTSAREAYCFVALYFLSGVM
jgi:hypothetical protein